MSGFYFISVELISLSILAFDIVVVAGATTPHWSSLKDLVVVLFTVERLWVKIYDRYSIHSTITDWELLKFEIANFRDLFFDLLCLSCSRFGFFGSGWWCLVFLLLTIIVKVFQWRYWLICFICFSLFGIINIIILILFSDRYDWFVSTLLCPFLLDLRLFRFESIPSVIILVLR